MLAELALEVRAAVERPTALVERVRVEVVAPDVRVAVAVAVPERPVDLVEPDVLVVLAVLVLADVRVVAPEVLVVLPNVLRAVV